MKMKKISVIAIGCALLMTAATACSTPASGSADDSPNTVQSQGTELGGITVISREEGSGTRSAFVELFELHDDINPDLTTISAEITNNTAVMMTSVAGDAGSIGYISLGSLNDTVKALKIDGVDATTANVSDGSYTISRPFNIAVKGELSPSAQDFLNFIMSAEGQDVIEASGYIRVSDSGSYRGAKPTEKIVVAGSSSVTPAMEALSEAYSAIQPEADIEIQQSDSSTGMNSTIDGICDIGMASRELKDSEIEKGLSPTRIAMDGIAVIVNKGNAADGLSAEQVKAIFSGEISDWSALQ
ncbi:MAG: substrate-binding domain-containing protein [Clostridiales Family XIII bacterium]|jgi:phosphate transport system substrate-binding protein|nr:substrate-binding domain-containing protein [Clostridiales Family XIII bacterium]